MQQLLHPVQTPSGSQQASQQSSSCIDCLGGCQDPGLPLQTLRICTYHSKFADDDADLGNSPRPLSADCASFYDRHQGNTKVWQAVQTFLLGLLAAVCMAIVITACNGSHDARLACSSGVPVSNL